MTITAPVTEKYNLGPVKSWVSNAAYLLGTKFGFTTIYGWRQSDPFPDHPSGHALDFMISSTKQGEDLKDYAVANHANLGIKYVIWNRTYYSDSNGWKGSPYTATSNPHTDHVHITFLDQPGPWINSPNNILPDTGTATLTAQIQAGETCAWKVNLPVNGPTCLIDKTMVRALLGASMLLIGGVAVLTGAILLYTTRNGGTASLTGIARTFIK